MKLVLHKFVPGLKPIAKGIAKAVTPRFKQPYILDLQLSGSRQDIYKGENISFKLKFTVRSNSKKYSQATYNLGFVTDGEHVEVSNITVLENGPQPRLGKPTLRNMPDLIRARREISAENLIRNNFGPGVPESVNNMALSDRFIAKHAVEQALLRTLR